MMKSLVYALAAVLGWTAYSHLSKAGRGRRSFGTTPDAFPFPTAISQARIDLEDEAAVRKWCSTLDCDEAQLRAAVRHSGPLVEAVGRHLARPR
jgi:hypothetical protein